MTSQLAMPFGPPAPETTAKRRQRKAERDRSLEALQLGRRREIIAIAHRVAVELAVANACASAADSIPDDCVTSPQVHEELVRRGLLTAEEQTETRWLGGVFPGGSGANARWRRVGYATLGSKGRAVAVWALIEGT